MKRAFPLVFALVLFIATVLPAPVRGQGAPQSASPQVEVNWATQHDVSPPLRDRPSVPRSDVPRERPLRPMSKRIRRYRQVLDSL